MLVECSETCRNPSPPPQKTLLRSVNSPMRPDLPLRLYVISVDSFSRRRAFDSLTLQSLLTQFLHVARLVNVYPPSTPTPPLPPRDRQPHYRHASFRKFPQQVSATITIAGRSREGEGEGEGLHLGILSRQKQQRNQIVPD